MVFQARPVEHCTGASGGRKRPALRASIHAPLLADLPEIEQGRGFQAIKSARPEPLCPRFEEFCRPRSVTGAGATAAGKTRQRRVDAAPATSDLSRPRPIYLE